MRYDEPRSILQRSLTVFSIIALLAVLSLALPGCSGEAVSDSTLLLQLETDLLPGVEFVGVEADLFPDLASLDGEALDRRTNYALESSMFPLPVADFEVGSSGSRVLRVRLRGASGRTRLERIAIVEVSGTRTATVIMTRSCEGISCPGSGDSATDIACLGGRCVDPRCGPESPEFCPAAECSSPVDCPAVAACADRRCDFGVCLPTVRALSCGQDQFCNPDVGCVARALLHCTDGVQNSGETDVDCGGGCSPCPTLASEYNDGWSWALPQPDAAPVRAVWSGADGEGWAIVQGDVLIRYEDESWVRSDVQLGSIDQGTRSVRDNPDVGNYSGIFGLSSSEVWLYGSGPLGRWNGIRWDFAYVARDEAVSAMWGSSAVDMWIGGPGGVLRHFDGVVWRQEESSTDLEIRAIDGTSASDVWAVASDASTQAILHWDGTRWSQQGSRPELPYTDIRAFAPDDVWAAGDGGVAHFDGSRWRLHTDSIGVGPITGFGGTAGNDLWLSRGSDLEGAVFHHDGNNWEEVDVGPLIAPTALFASAEGAVLLGSPGQLMRFQIGDPRLDYGLPIPTRGLDAVFEVEGQRWVAAGNQLLIRDGSNWRVEYSAAERTRITAIHGTASNDLWASGTDGTLLHRTTAGWSEAASGTREDLNDLWAVENTAVFAAGNAGTILFYDGTDWSPLASGTTDDLQGVWGANASDVWVVGDLNFPSLGTSLHWDGTSWLPEGPRGLAAHGTASNDVWVVGTTGASHWDGTSWQTVSDAPFDPGFQAVWARSPTEVYFVGSPFEGSPLGTSYGYTLYRWDGSNWFLSELPEHFAAGRDLWAAQDSNGVVLVATGDGLLARGPTP